RRGDVGATVALPGRGRGAEDRRGGAGAADAGGAPRGRIASSQSAPRQPRPEKPAADGPTFVCAWFHLPAAHGRPPGRVAPGRRFRLPAAWRPPPRAAGSAAGRTPPR